METTSADLGELLSDFAEEAINSLRDTARAARPLSS